MRFSINDCYKSIQTNNFQIFFTLIFSQRYKEIITIFVNFFEAINMVKNALDIKDPDWKD